MRATRSLFPSTLMHSAFKESCESACAPSGDNQECNLTTSSLIKMIGIKDLVVAEDKVFHKG